MSALGHKRSFRSLTVEWLLSNGKWTFNNSNYKGGFKPFRIFEDNVVAAVILDKTNDGHLSINFRIIRVESLNVAATTASRPDCEN